MSEQSAIIAWFDAYERLGEIESAQLNEAGLRPVAVRSMSEFEPLADSVQVVAIRVVDDPNPVAELRARLRAIGAAPMLVARVDRDRFDAVAAAIRCGADHVIAADDYSVSAWRLRGRPAPSVARPSRAYVFVDPVSQKLLALAQRVARAEIGVLVTGPTGAGKEVLARVIHEASPRSHGPFVALNCAALPETLIEGLLFGHEKGAFTGASASRAGLIEQAAGGTLFLDEIGEMPHALQARLLRVLQEREVTRLGASSVSKIDFRLVAATNRDLKEAIGRREFREDLYFRISSFRLHIPSLCDRPGDIVPLASQFLARHARDGSGPVLTDAAAAALLEYAWPGNVRELENVIQRALVLCPGNVIEPRHLLFDDAEVLDLLAGVDRSTGDPVLLDGPDLPRIDPLKSRSAMRADPGLTAVSAPALESAVRASEYQAIMNAIRGTSNRNEAAARLGISPRTLRYKLARLREPLAGAGMVALSEGVA